MTHSKRIAVCASVLALLLLDTITLSVGAYADGAPAQGSQAPDFSLNTLDRKYRVKLSSFKNKKPVVLIFGSYT
ncbi:MAG: hypothetical protein KC652_10100 [Cyanobacteria bacterium HKST-UBA01]|nr:hypothetical protein [Cyanobacteria bacterium HKST-UBA01]